MPCLRAPLLSLLVLAAAVLAGAAVISGNVTDASGALVPRARIEIGGGSLTQPMVLVSDAQGHFASADLPPGTYSVQISCAGFETSTESVSPGGANATLAPRLSVAAAHQEITVGGKALQFANTDPVYRQLRTVRPGVTSPVRDLTIAYEAGTFHVAEGTLTWLAPVSGYVTGAIFLGKGSFELKPVTSLDRAELLRRTNAEQVSEHFDEVVFRFSRDVQQQLLAGSKELISTPPGAAPALERWRDQVRQRREIPEGLSDTLLNGDEMENVDAEVLASIYNPGGRSFFSAYIHGAKHKDLRFLFRARGGALPQLGSPEEVGRINHAPAAMDDGVWYLAHRRSEYEGQTASSLEERRFVTARHFKIETVIGTNCHLTSVATVRFAAVSPGERVIRFELLPNLRVTRVTGSDRNDLYFIQESRKADGSFYVILPARLDKGSEFSVTIEYTGDKVITQAGSGSFYVDSREAWYPNLNHFSERALYDLTYKVPKHYSGLAPIFGTKS